jgi:RNA polymerase sigma-70 factor (ECF subfamily)
MAQAAGRVVEASDFTALTEPFRRELLAHCYRMLGSVHDAEDLVQETYLRAWRGYDRFEGRSSVRAWLYRIATNACLTALEHRSRRVLPSGLGAPSDDPGAPAEIAGSDVAWLEPIPDALLVTDTDDPARIVALRQSVRLAFVAGLQYLPARQRAVLLLRDVLEWPASEVATLLGASVPSVKSLLQRARARLAAAAPEAAELSEPSEPELRAVLDRYMAAFESSDATILPRLLLEDATIEVTPARTWFAGYRTCLAFMTSVLGDRGDWRMVATSANGQPAAIASHRTADGSGHDAYAVAVLTATPTGIRRVTLFSDPTVVERFGQTTVA